MQVVLYCCVQHNWQLFTAHVVLAARTSQSSRHAVHPPPFCTWRCVRCPKTKEKNLCNLIHSSGVKRMPLKHRWCAMCIAERGVVGMHIRTLLMGMQQRQCHLCPRPDQPTLQQA
jgi:hypothetical protein